MVFPMIETWFHLKDIYEHRQVIFAVLMTGLIADALYWLLKPSSTRIAALRLFAFGIPAILFGSFFLILITTAGIWWSVHLWTGAVFLSGVVGLLLSFLTHPFNAQKNA